MCGFIGIKSNDINREKAYQVLQKISHRGPDEEGVFFDETIYIGHKRLVVVDKEFGKQPYTFNQLVMIYNGELYNTSELREDLKQKGYLFNGHSDTEILIKLFYEYREECVKKLNGIFSFMIYDTQTKEIYCFRDRVGVKPFYYYYENSEFMASSEIKTILNYFDINKISVNGLQEILGLGPSHSPGNGIYQNIKELRPGHYLILKKNQLKIHQYWQVKSLVHHEDFKTTVEKVRFLLEDSIKRQLVSDVPLCTYLSGGLDSTAITLIGQKYKPDLESYSIDYINNQKYFNANNFQVAEDNDFINFVVDHFNINHHRCVISNEELIETLKNAVILRDMPGMADIDSSLYWFSTKIKPQFTVALSGECADEIFGGYPWFYRTFKDGCFPWLSNLDERNNLLNDNYQKKLELREYVDNHYKKALREVPLNGDETLEEIKHKRLSYLNMLYFMTTLLDRKDRMTMGASLEVRVPFADHRLIEYLYNVPWEMKFYQNKEKGLLKEAVKDIVPYEIVYRKKNPYPKTHHPKYEKLVKSLFRNCLNNKNSVLFELFNKKALYNLLENDKSFESPWFGQLMTKPQLIAYLYQFDYWFNEYNLNII
ncbi:asparagine synthase (glutamine-hydrolyzing) [Mycoplasmatota bacterium]|nr:asparagine synthase (glutamine-hydrolyzing) [Mycoplasmatota bacterium]